MAMNIRSIPVESTKLCPGIVEKLKDVGVTLFTPHQVHVMEAMMERARDVVMVGAGKNRGKSLSFIVVITNHIMKNDLATVVKSEVLDITTTKDGTLIKNSDSGKSMMSTKGELMDGEERKIITGRSGKYFGEYVYIEGTRNSYMVESSRKIVEKSDGCFVGKKRKAIDDSVEFLTNDMKRSKKCMLQEINVGGKVKNNETAGSNLVALILLSNKDSMVECKEAFDWLLMNCVESNVLVSERNCGDYNTYNMLKKANVWITCVETLSRMTDRGMDFSNLKWFVMDHAMALCYKEANQFLRRMMKTISEKNNSWQLTAISRSLNSGQMGYIRKLCKADYLFEDFDVEYSKVVGSDGGKAKIPKFFQKSFVMEEMEKL